MDESEKRILVFHFSFRNAISSSSVSSLLVFIFIHSNSDSHEDFIFQRKYKVKWMSEDVMGYFTIRNTTTTHHITSHLLLQLFTSPHWNKIQVSSTTFIVARNVFASTRRKKVCKQNFCVNVRQGDKWIYGIPSCLPYWYPWAYSSSSLSSSPNGINGAIH